MARLARSEIFSPDEITTLHLMARVVRRCYLLGDDPVNGKNYDHRKVWVEDQLTRLAACMGIDLLGFSILSNHFHLVVRNRPDVVACWDDTEVARRWLTLCPLRKCTGGPAVISELDLNSIRNDPAKVKEIRSRLSDPSWWMRLLCQRIATKANDEDEEVGKFWQARYKAVKLLDESAILACAAYVDLNPIRAGLAETLEGSDFTSVQRRLEAMTASAETATHEATAPIDNGSTLPRPTDRMLSPILLDELRDPLGPHPSCTGARCSDKGFLPISQADYLSLLDWTARQPKQGKCGTTPEHLAPIFERLSLSSEAWCRLASDFGRMFHVVAGQPRTVEGTRSRRRHARYRLPRSTRELLAAES